jgi:hypothetical protein
VASSMRDALASLGLAAAVALFVGGGALASSGTSCSWRDTTPSALPPTAHVTDIEAISPSDAWAVGYFGDSDPLQPLLLHWNGRAWTRHALALPGTELGAVSATSTRDVWAVGRERGAPNGSNLGAVTMHWDGSRWRVVRSGEDRRSETGLDDVLALSPNDVWTVGSGFVLGAGTSPLLEHWDGRSWHTVAVRGEGQLYAIDGTSSRDLLAVGYAMPPGSGGYHDKALALRWDGARWTNLRLPRSRRVWSRLRAVAAVSPGRFWAIGDTWIHAVRGGSLPYNVRVTDNRAALDATAERFRRSRTRLTDLLAFRGIVAAPGQAAWAWSGKSIARWDRRGWRPGPRVPFPKQRPSAGPPEVSEIAPIGGRSFWLAGSYSFHTFLARYVCA